MNTPIIRTTRDYNLFKFYSQNRCPGSNKTIEKSIRQIDLTPYVPIVVNHEYYIVDGQNRFLSCKKMNLPVYYVVLPDTFDIDSSIIALNRDQRAWIQEEFLHFHAEINGGCYKELEEFKLKHNLNISNAIAIFPDKQINSVAKTSFRL